MSNRGDRFEDRVFGLLGEKIESGYFGLHPNNAKVLRRPTYWSRDRESEIIFDASIEIYRQEGKQPFLIWIWECKDYSHPVPVDDVEEFHAKLQQVGSDRTKGTIVTSSTFQIGGLKFGEANGIGLVRMLPDNSIIHIREMVGKRDGGLGVYRSRDLFRNLLSGQVSTDEASATHYEPEDSVIKRALIESAHLEHFKTEPVYAQMTTGALHAFDGIGEYLRKEWEAWMILQPES